MQKEAGAQAGGGRWRKPVAQIAQRRGGQQGRTDDEKNDPCGVASEVAQLRFRVLVHTRACFEAEHVV